MRTLTRLLFTTIFVASIVVNSMAQGAYTTGVYRNLFKEYLNKSDAEIKTKVDAAFQQIFHGTSNQQLYYEVGTDMAYILDVANNDVRSEGMSYGLMICVQLDKKAEFDKLWKWTKTYMQHSSGTLDGFFRWQLNTSGSAIDNNAAPDGEAYFITALFFAAHRWGNGTGIYNYEAEAQSTIQKVQTGTGGVDLLFNTNSKLITFGVNGDSYTFTDPSYNLPGFFELWAKWSKSNTTFWAQTPDAARTLLKNASHSTSGLFADYSNFDGTPKSVSYNTNANRFMYDAWRAVMNIGVDYHWFQKDTWQPTGVTKLLTFFKNKGTNYLNHYDWDGGNPGGDHSTGLVACNAASCLAITDKTLATPFVQELWNVGIPSGQYRYYDGMLYMLGLLNCSGNFKIWDVIPEGPSVTITAPAAGASFVTPASVTISATVTPLANSTITKVELYEGTTLIETAQTAPYSFTIADVTVGSHTYTVKATDSNGKTGSKDVAVTVTKPVQTGTFTIRAIGVAGTESINLELDGKVVKTFTLTTSYADYTYTGNIGASTIRVNYTNDATGLDAQIDYITVGTDTYQAEDQAKNTGFYTNGSCGGGGFSEMMHCSGYIEFTTLSGTSKPTVTSPIEYCQNATAAPLTATGTALQWYAAATGGTGSTTAPTPSTTTVGKTTYYVTQTLNSKESERAAIEVSVLAQPAAPTVTSPVTYQLNATAVALTATGTNLKWYSVATGGTGSTTAPVPFTTANSSTTYYVSQTVATCESPRASITVVVGTPQMVKLYTGWNLVGCPLDGSTPIESAMASIWSKVTVAKDLESAYLSNNPAALNSLTNVQYGRGYMVKVSADCTLDWVKK